jgi:hypothetical protein
LIADTVDLPASVWWNGEYTATGATAKRIGKGYQNTRTNLYYHKVIRDYNMQPAGAGIIKEVVIETGFCHHKMS